MLKKRLTWYSFETSPGYWARYRLEIVCVNYTWSSVRRHGERHQNARLARTWIETSSTLACSTIWTRCSALWGKRRLHKAASAGLRHMPVAGPREFVEQRKSVVHKRERLTLQ